KPCVVMRGSERLDAVRLLSLRRMVIEKDEVHIGACGQLTAAELAHAQDRGAPAGDASMHAGKFLLDGIKGGADCQVGQVGKSLSSPFGIDGAGEQPDAA